MTSITQKAKLLLGLFISNYVSVTLAAQEIQLNTVITTYHQVAKRLTVDGIVAAIKRATISAQTSGQVVEINFDIDDFVKKGNILAQLKNVQQVASLDQSEAQVLEAKAVLKAALTEYNRINELYQKQVISAAQLDKARADLDVAKARLEATQSSINQATELVEYTMIRAPYSGIVLERHIELGEIAVPGKPIMTGFSLENLRVVATISQDDMAAIGNAQLVVEQGKNKFFFESKNMTISQYADPNTHTFKVRIDLPSNTPNIYPGMHAKVAFVTGQEKRLLIPTQVVAYRSEVRSVYVLDKENKISMRHVRLGGTYGEMVEVLAGLEPGERIAMNPVDATIVLKNQRTKLTS